MVHSFLRQTNVFVFNVWVGKMVGNLLNKDFALSFPNFKRVQSSLDVLD